MGKGNDPNSVCVTSSGSMAVAVGATDWLQAAGPEVTPDELIAYRDRTATGQDPAWDREWLQYGLDMIGDPALAEKAALPSRRALEALMALQLDMDLTDFQAQNMHRSWSELIADAEGMRGQPTEAYGGVLQMARMTELTLRRQEQAHGEDILAATRPGARVRHWEDSNRHDESPLLQAAREKAGPGATSGRLEDYSRAELRKLLGFLERDCKHLTDEDLRGMALAGHLVPKFSDSPAHATLAASDARRYYSQDGQAKAFKKAMRTEYGKLARRYHADLDHVGNDTVFDQLAERNPLIAASKLDVTHRPFANYATSGEGTFRPDSERNQVAEGAAQVQKTSLELAFEPAFRSFVGDLPGTPNLQSVKPGLGGRRGCLGLYEPSTGDIYIHSSLVKLIDKAKKGEADPRAIEHAVSTVAHELFHAAEGRDEGNRRTGRAKASTAEHCLDEGATEALARIHTEKLAVSMGLWDRERDGSLRGHAAEGSYPAEVQSVNALVAAACGELKGDMLKAGEYAQPDILSPAAREFMCDMHTTRGVWGRMGLLAEKLSERTGAPVEESARRVKDILTECKSSRYQFRTKTVRNPETNRLETEYIRPENLSDRLHDLLSDLT